MRERGEDKTSAGAPEAESLGGDFWKSAQVIVRTAQFGRTLHPTARWISESIFLTLNIDGVGRKLLAHDEGSTEMFCGVTSLVSRAE
jgi:hypothetical protein